MSKGNNFSRIIVVTAVISAALLIALTGFGAGAAKAPATVPYPGGDSDHTRLDRPMPAVAAPGPREPGRGQDDPGQPGSVFIGALNGEAFSLRVTGDSVSKSSIVTSLPVFKAFGLNKNGQNLLYTSLKSGLPSGELYVENLDT